MKDKPSITFLSFVWVLLFDLYFIPKRSSYGNTTRQTQLSRGRKLLLNPKSLNEVVSNRPPDVVVLEASLDSHGALSLVDGLSLSQGLGRDQTRPDNAPLGTERISFTLL